MLEVNLFIDLSNSICSYLSIDNGLLILSCVRNVMVIVVGNGHGDMSSNPGRDIAFSHSTNTLGNGMNPIILPPAMDK